MDRKIIICMIKRTVIFTQNPFSPFMQFQVKKNKKKYIKKHLAEK